MRAALLAFALAVAGCSSAQLGSSRVDPALAALAPADSIWLAGVRMAEIRSTPLYQKMVAQQRVTELDDFARRTGFDPRKDVQELLAASDGADTVVLARGAFRISPPAGVRKSVYKGATIYSQPEGAFAILDASTAAAGPERAVRKALDQKQAGGAGAKALLDRARALPAAGQIWFVSNGWGSLPERLGAGQSPYFSNASKILRAIETGSATVDLRSGVAARAEGLCRSEEDAKTLGDALRGLVGMGRLSVPENQPDLLRLFDGLKVDQQQRTLVVNIRIPQDLVDRLSQLPVTR
jgi:hypothetical protein